MKSTLCIVASSLSFSLGTTCLTAQEKPIQAELIEVSAHNKTDRKDPDLEKLYLSHMPAGVKLTFLIKAKNISQILEDTLSVKGDKSWKCDKFPRVSKTANACSFSVTKEGDTSNLRGLKLNGTIDILVGTKLITKDFTLNELNKPMDIGDFKITLIEGSIKVEGKHKRIKTINVTLNNKELKTFGSSWSDISKSYNFEGIDKGAKVSLSYWEGLETKTVQFSN